MLKERFALSDEGAKDLKKGIASSVFSNIALMAPIFLLVWFLKETIARFETAGGEGQGFWVWAGLSILCVALIFLTQYLQYGCVYIATYKESAMKRISLAEKLRVLPLSFFSRRDVTDLTTAIMADCTEQEHAFSHAIPQLFGAAVSTLIMAAGVIAFDWRMAGALLWVLPVSAVLIVASAAKQKQSTAISSQNERCCAEAIQEMLENIPEIKAFNCGENVFGKLRGHLAASEKARRKSELVSGMFVTAAQSILRLGFATVILYGGALAASGEISFFKYLVFLVIASRIYDPIGMAFIYLSVIFWTSVRTERIRSIMDQPEQQGDEEVSIERFDVKFEDVSFRYLAENEAVLEKVGFSAEQGKVTALIGPSGSGKSTVGKLLARFWDPDSGSITIGGVDIQAVIPEKLLRYISVVFQDVVLFNDTVLENIRIGRKEATDEEVLRAAAVAQCDEFVARLENGYQTMIGENGKRLSGGERQRISIARALLKDAPIVLLDEATSSLDVENETRIQSALSALIRDKTVIVIAHRMRTISSADKIVVLENGRVAEQGAPDALAAGNGVYAHMLALQNQASMWKLGKQWREAR
ncbi:MAG: ABC transporter ATP-binding protein/permease [Clostridiales Family XIII bacterium]|nr:ABC transporter ATP-binding protein/permease [Clostridiales Family XIII bacterium]